MRSAVEWIEGLSPWPEEFGLGRMRELMAALDMPQVGYPSLHVVGSNGKSTATRVIEELLASTGLPVGAYLSPHVRSWNERIRVRGEEANFDEAIERVRPACEEVGATQFEALTAAAFAAFAAAGVRAAVVEAGLGGRLDATNVVDAPVVLLTNVALEHTDVLGDTREAIAREKLAVAGAGATVVLPDLEFAPLVPKARVLVGGARAAAEAFLEVPLPLEVDVRLPGRLERRGAEVWDGAHNPAGVAWLLERLPEVEVVVASILRDKDAEAMLALLGRAAGTLVATESSSARALPAAELARLATPWFERVEALPNPAAALARARELSPRVLVTGSLYLIQDLSANEEGVGWPRSLVSS